MVLTTLESVCLYRQSGGEDRPRPLRGLRRDHHHLRTAAPKWEFNAHKIVVEVGGNATIYHSTFRIEGVPVFYFPFATHPDRTPTTPDRVSHSLTSEALPSKARSWESPFSGPSIAAWT